MTKRPNILVMFSDDHAQWAAGCYGNQEIHTPNIDYLAQTGVQMLNAFTPTPVCSPARANFLTGKLASQHGVHDYLVSNDPAISERRWLSNEITLPELLQDVGYRTGFCGKWHLGDDPTPQPGFDNWFSLNGDYPIDHGGTHGYSDQGTVRQITGRKSRIITEHAVRFLRECSTEQPFFLMVCHTSTHSPWTDQPERLVSRYQQCSFGDIPDDEAYPFGMQNLESTLATRSDPREALSQYYAAVTLLDESTGMLLDELEALGQRDNTLIVYTSDHGLNCGHHGIWGKGNGTLPLNMVEESIRIPLIFNQPGRLYDHQRRHEFVDHLDVFCTLLDVAGVELADETVVDYPGRSFLPMLDNSHAIIDWRDVQFCEYGNVRMIRTERYKLVRRYPDGPHEFFDLRTDPREVVNLFRDPDQQVRIQSLTEQLERHFEQYEDATNSGLRVRELPQHNFSEAWRSDG